MDRFEAEEYSIGQIFSEQGRNFHIPVYQRPYSWLDAQCQKLWEDIKDFALSKDKEGKPAYRNIKNNLDRCYFLGPIVVYESDKNTHQKEIIDGQQRTTTLMLLLRAFYEYLVRKQDKYNEDETDTIKEIRNCLWKWTYDKEMDKDVCSFDSPILRSDAIDECAFDIFVKIMSKEGISIDEESVKSKDISKYIRTYVQFVQLIKKDFEDDKSSPLQSVRVWQYVSMILNKCTFLFINCHTQEAALKIFDTLNNRGMQLCDADILKAKIYETLDNDTGAIEQFRSEWNIFAQFSKACRFVKKSDQTDPLTEMFRQLMMWRKAEKGLSGNDIALRDFFDSAKEEQGNGKEMITGTLLSEKLIPLSAFWYAISLVARQNADDDNPDPERVHQPRAARQSENAGDDNLSDEANYVDDAKKLISNEAEKYLQVLGCVTKNAFWRYLISVYFLKHRGNIEFAQMFQNFLEKITAYTLYNSVIKTADSFKKCVYRKLCEIYKNGDFICFDSLDEMSPDRTTVATEVFLKKFDARELAPEVCHALILLHAYRNKNQMDLIPLDAQIEHIFPKSWEKNIGGQARANGIDGVTSQDMDQKLYEVFGNKVMLERPVNNAARDKYYDFKCAVYHGMIPPRVIRGLEAIRDENNKLKLTKELTEREKGLCTKASSIADIHDIWDLPVWGKDQI